ncbi:MAG: bifunctional nuclease family protein [Actinobacteria bacterium]|nr:bifunctional nuclease family protein [Actinomycetota bacterium]
MHEMEVHGVNLDVVTNQPVIILKDTVASRFLPIWIGQFEATAILMEIQGVKPSRPLTHDLLKSVIGDLHAEVKQIVISDLRDGTFYAQIHILSNSTSLMIDARPSDAIALAVRVRAPIFADETVLEKAAVFSEEGEDEVVDRFREFLDNIEPEDFKNLDFPTD